MTTQGRLRDALVVPTFRVLAGSFLITMLGGSVASLAMTVLVYRETRSAFWSAATFTLMFVPYLFAGTALSALTDRWPPRRLLVGCDLTTAAIMAVMALPVTPVAVRMGLLVVVGLIAPISAGTRSALVAEVLPPKAYVPGRAVMRMISQGAQIVGAAVSGILLVAVSPAGVLAIDAASYVASATLVFVGLRHRRDLGRARREAAATRRPGLFGDSLDGARQVLALPALRRALLIGWTVPFFAVAPEALAAPYVEQAGLPASAVGWWFLALPLGTVLGDLAVVWRVAPATRQRLVYPLALGVPGLLVLVGLAPLFALAWLPLLLSGASSSYQLGLDQRVLDRTPEALTARMFALQTTGLMVLQGIGFSVWGAAGDLTSAHTVIVVAGAVGSLAVVVLAVANQRARTAAPAAQGAVAGA